MTARTKHNPFAQSPTHWHALFILPEKAAEMAEESFEDMALSIARFETDEAQKLWTCELLFGESPDREELLRRLSLIAKLHHVPVPELTIRRVEQRDWLAQVARDFPPLSIGRFYIHGAHVTATPPAGSTAIQVEAGAAFGSGEHGTTSCCLEALDWLAHKRSFRHILDMGCGSGILAIAAAKLWKTDVLAADIDPVAVRVTQENARINRETRIRTYVSDGYSAKPIQEAAKFDLIIANILARPLIALAPELSKHLAPGGVAVLSGLLGSQETQVLSAHVMQKLKLTRRFPSREWLTLVLER